MRERRAGTVLPLDRRDQAHQLALLDQVNAFAGLYCPTPGRKRHAVTLDLDTRFTGQGKLGHRLIAEGKSDPLQAALGFALSRPEASAVLVGVTTAAEMSAVVAAAMSPPPDLDWDEMALDDAEALAWAAD